MLKFFFRLQDCADTVCTIGLESFHRVAPHRRSAQARVLRRDEPTRTVKRCARCGRRATACFSNRTSAIGAKPHPRGRASHGTYASLVVGKEAPRCHHDRTAASPNGCGPKLFLGSKNDAWCQKGTSTFIDTDDIIRLEGDSLNVNVRSQSFSQEKSDGPLLCLPKEFEARILENGLLSGTGALATFFFSIRIKSGRIRHQ